VRHEANPVRAADDDTEGEGGGVIDLTPAIRAIKEHDRVHDMLLVERFEMEYGVDAVPDCKGDSYSSGPMQQWLFDRSREELHKRRAEGKWPPLTTARKLWLKLRRIPVIASCG
jgi:hypothetical protein